jgi:hypothetical protein
MMETKLSVPVNVRELVSKSIDQVETAFHLLFESATNSIAPDSLNRLTLLQRTIKSKLDYARSISQASDFRETTAAQAKFLRTQIEIAGDLIREAGG